MVKITSDLDLDGPLASAPGLMGRDLLQARLDVILHEIHDEDDLHMAITGTSLIFGLLLLDRDADAALSLLMDRHSISYVAAAQVMCLLCHGMFKNN